MEIKVAAIIVTYNRLGLLKECVQSLRDQTYKKLSIIVVNNGSTDGTTEWLDMQRDILKIHQANVGGAGGFFTGIKYACEHGYEYSWIMDDDVVANCTALEALINSTNGIKGFLCSRVLDMNGEQCNVPKISTAKSNSTGELLWGELLNIHLLRVDITSFVSVLIRNSVVYELGLPYKEYFIWGDDTEFTSRISKFYSSYMVIDSVVVHKRNQQGVLSLFTETNKKRIDKFFYSYRNRIHYQRTFLTKILVFLYSLSESARLLFRGKCRASYVVLCGLVKSITFRPQIQYPQRCLN